MRRWLAGQFARPSGLIGRFWIGPWLDRIAGPSNRLALKMLSVRPGERVLEVGFGGGGLLAALLGTGAAELIGVETSEAMLRRGRRRFRRALDDGRMKLLHASVERLPLETASVDRAVSVASLYFWLDSAAALAELARVIRPGGRLVLSFEPADQLRKWPGHRYGFQLFEVDEVEQLIREAGFDSMLVETGYGRKPDRFVGLSAERVGANGRG